MHRKPTRLAAALAATIEPALSNTFAAEVPRKKGPTRIMYIECKAGELTWAARIGRVRFSKTWKTVYYQGKVLQRIPGGGYNKSNYFDKETGEDYWISGPKKDGSDRLYNERLAIEIDENIREEYWITIRNQPERSHEIVA